MVKKVLGGEAGFYEGVRPENLPEIARVNTFEYSELSKPSACVVLPIQARSTTLALCHT